MCLYVHIESLHIYMHIYILYTHILSIIFYMYLYMLMLLQSGYQHSLYGEFQLDRTLENGKIITQVVKRRKFIIGR